MNLASTCFKCDHVDMEEEEVFAPQQSRGEKSSLPNDRPRVQEFVTDFAKCAVRGVPCEVVDTDSGTVFPAAYSIDPPMQKLTLRRGTVEQGLARKPFREFELSRVEDIFDFRSADTLSAPSGRPAVPEVVRRTIGTDVLRERLFVVVLKDELSPVLVLESSSVDRDRFIMCVKVLRLYAQTVGLEDMRVGELGAGAIALSA
eukprot:TRINITY_DN9010_c0_g1_i2.p2 TRINITY_DN9010_c0_g1~~TRINITY_DN9010_c0_g1_i2.p2  ORF type:complete len:202 (-),score=43.27 TRINITY_DN9010_c0_g1_i2:38-643(-)